jgi:hypothetical protein
MSMARAEGRTSFGECVQMMLSAGRWTEEGTFPNQTLRSCTMITIEECSILTGLEAKRAALQRELSRVDSQIHQTEQAKARIAQRIKTLEQVRREAA